MILAESPRRQRVTKLVNWGHWFALANIVIALIIASIFVFSSPFPSTVLGGGYLFANWLGHISFVTFFGFVIFVLPLCYVVTSSRVVKAAGSIIAAIGLALLAFDALLYNKTGFHISFSSADLLKAEAQNQIVQFGWQQWGFLFLLFVVWLGFQLILANAIWKRIDRLLHYSLGIPLSSFFVVCFVSSHAIHVWADAQLYQPVIKQDNMFPLSYPATAKTTMSRYGLLDIDSYLERKQLQFDPMLHQFNYPLAPVYCSIDNSRNLYLIVQTDTQPLSDMSMFDLRQTDSFFSNATTPGALVDSTLFGVPEIYMESIRAQIPVLLALPQAQGMAVNLIAEDSTLLERYKRFQSQSTNSGLTIAFLPAKAIDDFVTPSKLASSDVIIATRTNPSESAVSKGQLFTNLAIKTPLASIEDLAPTVMDALGCAADPATYSTGQSLLSPSRNWIVSTSGEKVVVVHEGQQIEVLSNGSYEILNIDTSNRSDEALNVDLLSRAIKHLTRFSS